MVTPSQLFFKKQIRTLTKKRTRTPSLKRCPQKKGIVINVSVIKPKKPNSARRHIAKIMLSYGKKIRASIPGFHKFKDRNLKQYSKVLIRGGRSRDLIGLHYKVILGKFDAKPPQLRRNSRSKYGVKKPLAFWGKTNMHDFFNSFKKVKPVKKKT